jgi:hypothetical protein
MSDKDKHSSLSRYRLNDSCKRLYIKFTKVEQCFDIFKLDFCLGKSVFLLLAKILKQLQAFSAECNLLLHRSLQLKVEHLKYVPL